MRVSPRSQVALACVTVAAAAQGCLFDLGDVQAVPAFSLDDAGVQSDAPDTSVFPDAAAPDAMDAQLSEDVKPADACWPASDAELCAAASVECGPFETVDGCGDARNVTCGPCDASAYCEAGLCIDYAYAWKTSGWTPCTADCGGGTHTQTVWCERSDGTIVGDASCTGTKPPTTEGCNTQDCCSTGSLQAGRRCDGDAVAQFYPWDPNEPSQPSLDACQATCTSWATDAGMTQWCCQFADNSDPGDQWGCRVYESHSNHASSTPDMYYASVGECQ